MVSGSIQRKSAGDRAILLGRIRCSALGSSGAVMEQVKEVDVDKDIAIYFKNLQQGSDIRGVAMDGR